MNDIEQQKAKATAFRSLHHGAEALLLPNVWDVASARIVEEAGYPAIATTSAGIAFSLGYPDGQKITPGEMFARVGRIARAVKVPVTADIEAGYGAYPEDAARTATAVIEAGAVGINLEDATGNPEQPLAALGLQQARIRAVREAALKTGVPLLVNARTDVFLAQVGEPETRLDEALRRGVAYRDAGADCVFVPGLLDMALIQRIVAGVGCPINILAGPGGPTVGEFRQLGVARVSLGSWPMRATLGLLREIAKELKESGTYRGLEQAPAYSEINGMIR